MAVVALLWGHDLAAWLHMPVVGMWIGLVVGAFLFPPAAVAVVAAALLCHVFGVTTLAVSLVVLAVCLALTALMAMGYGPAGAERGTHEPQPSLN